MTPLPTAEALRVVLDGPTREVRDRAREVLGTPAFAPVQAESLEEHRARVLEQARALAAAGGTALGFPVAYGGGGDVAGSVAAFETLAFADLSTLVKCGVQFGLFGGAVLHLGTERHHERYLRDIVTLDLPGCFAMTETGHGSNVQELETTATYDPAAQEFVVHSPTPGARKDYIGGAARDGRLAAVFAQLVTRGVRHGVHCFLVPIRGDDGAPMPGVTIGDCGAKAGLHGVDNGRLTFDEVRVPREALLDRFATVAPDGTYSSPVENPTRRFFTMLGTLVQGRVCVAGGAVSATKVALAIAVRYAERRRQFGPPDGEEVVLLDYLAHQRRLLPALATTYALSFVQHELAASLEAAYGDADHPERARRELETRAAGVKALATWHATSAIQTCREACGGAGYLSENRLPHLKADTDVFTTFEGDNTVLLQLVAKSLLTDYRDRFGELDALGTARFVADQVVDAVVERTGVRSLLANLRDAFVRDDDGVPDRAAQRELLASREEHVLESLALRLKNGIGAGREPFAVFNACQDHVLLAARVHVERVVLEAFAAAVERCQGDVRALLDRVCDLHALATIEADRAWFLEHGRLTAARSKGITAAVNELCRELRPHARALVDAFGIPESLLAAPIALDPAAAAEHPDADTATGATGGTTTNPAAEPDVRAAS